MKTEQNRLEKMTTSLLQWFSENARDLPWRKRTHMGRILTQEERAYRVWVSEIMLQQTRVEAVKPYYVRFLEALPGVKELAECPEDRLLKLWEGLGYYNRVRNMQKAAIEIQSHYNGKMPDQYESLLKMPGIGSYTAGAIASIAWGRSVPAVDGNVLRVISRIVGNTEDISKQSIRKQFEENLGALIRSQALDAGAFNQALMELGALICIPNGTPNCAACPAGAVCYAREHSCQADLPVKQASKPRKIENRTVFVIRDSEHAAIRKRPSRGLLAGLYELPSETGHLSMEEALQKVKEYGFLPIRIQPLPQAKHIFSHIEWHMIGYLVMVEDQETSLTPQMIFTEPQKTEKEYSIPAAYSAYTSALSLRLGKEKFE